MFLAAYILDCMNQWCLNFLHWFYWFSRCLLKITHDINGSSLMLGNKIILSVFEGPVSLLSTSGLADTFYNKDPDSDQSHELPLLEHTTRSVAFFLPFPTCLHITCTCTQAYTHTVTHPVHIQLSLSFTLLSNTVLVFCNVKSGLFIH